MAVQMNSSTCLLLLSQKKSAFFVEDVSWKHSEAHTNTLFFLWTGSDILTFTINTAVWEFLSTPPWLKVACVKIKINK